MADTDDIQERIRHRAHELWESEGRPHGRDSDHWSQAEAEIRGAGALEPTGKVAGSRRKTAVSKATSKPAGKSTRAAAESLSEVANSSAAEPVKPAKAKPAAPKAKADAAPAEEAAPVKAPAKAAKATPAKSPTAKSPAAKPPRNSKKDGGKSATAG